MRAKFELLEELIFARLCSDFRGNYLVLYVSGEENRIPLQRDGSSEGATTGMGSFAISLLQLHLTPMLVAQAEFCPKACFFTAEPEGLAFQKEKEFSGRAGMCGQHGGVGPDCVCGHASGWGVLLGSGA